MARTTNPLTDTKIRTAKPKEKDYKLFDGGGLFILITKRGTKLWRLKYRFDKKEKLLSLGVYPEVSLSRARELKEENKKLIGNSINPIDLKKEKKELQAQEATKKQNNFKSIALERLEKIKDDISPSHYKRSFNLLKNDVYPFIGKKPLDEVEASDIILILQKMMERDVRTSAKQAYHAINKTFKYAVSNGKAKRNPAGDIEATEIIGKSKEKHYPTITDNQGIKRLLTTIKAYQGETSTKYALLLLIYTGVRPSNARLALWNEIDFNNKQWIIPAEKMKARDEFIIPLSNTVMKMLEELKGYGNKSKYLFPSTKGDTPISDGTLLGAIRRMGYTKEDFTPHGVRAMFSTIAHEKSPFKYDVIETQLAHSIGNAVSQAYNRAKYLDERVELMQWWSDYLDEV